MHQLSAFQNEIYSLIQGGSISTGQNRAGFVAGIDSFGAINGSYAALVAAGYYGELYKSVLILSNGDINLIRQMTPANSVNLHSISNNGTGVTFPLVSPESVFSLNGDYLLVKAYIPIDGILFVLSTKASESVNFKVETQMPDDSWCEIKVIDGTNGFKQSGAIIMQYEDLYENGCNPGSDGKYTFRLTRQASTVDVTPEASSILIYDATAEYTWDKDGNVVVRSINIVGDADQSNLLTKSLLTTAGDQFVYQGGESPGIVRLPVGSAGQSPVVDTSEDSQITWMDSPGKTYYEQVCTTTDIGTAWTSVTGGSLTLGVGTWKIEADVYAFYNVNKANNFMYCQLYCEEDAAQLGNAVGRFMYSNSGTINTNDMRFVHMSAMLVVTSGTKTVILRGNCTNTSSPTWATAQIQTNSSYNNTVIKASKVSHV